MVRLTSVSLSDCGTGSSQGILKVHMVKEMSGTDC